MPRTQPIKHLSVLTFVLAAVLQSSVSAQTTVWGLNRGDRFQVETTIERETQIELGQAASSASKCLDSFTFEYRVETVINGSDVALQVRVVRAERKSDENANASDARIARQLALLQNLSVIIVVDVDGVVKSIHGYRESLAQLADVNQTSLQLLERSLPEAVFTSWLGHPFWMTAAPDKRATGEHWERIHQLSLGELGSLRTIATCEIDSVEKELATVIISGDSRFLPPPVSDGRRAATLLQFTGTSATVAEFSGNGSIVFPVVESADATPEKGDRPQFDRLSLSMQCSGEGTVQLRGTEQSLRFTQKQTLNSRLLPGYRFGQQRDPRMFLLPPR